MLVLDTDHLSTLGDVSETGRGLLERLRDSGDEVVTSIVTVEKNLQGWLAAISRAKTAAHLIAAYERFRKRADFIADWTVLSWDLEAHQRFDQPRKIGVRIGTHDLRIACITLEHDATLLTRNAKDFAKVPGLRFANWLD